MIKRLRAFVAMIKFWGYDISRFFRHFNYLVQDNTEDRLKGSLTIAYHGIEKGLAMAEMRLGFGEKQILKLISLQNKYMDKGFSIDEIEFIQSVKVLNEYVKVNDKNNFKINEQILENTKKINQRCNIYNSSEQLSFDTDSFFSMTNAPFDQFAISRHSVRNYTKKEIPDEIINECVKIAQNSPSSCNRQPIRVYAVKDNELLLQIMNLQIGNRGFGHLASTLFIITSNVSLFHNFMERNEPTLNAGMFSMSLLYSLHQHNIGACSLNWCASIKSDKKLRELLSIPENEMIHMIISCGYPPKTFKVASSPRKNTNDILRIIKK